MLLQILSHVDLPVLTAMTALSASFAFSVVRLGVILVRERRRTK